MESIGGDEEDCRRTGADGHRFWTEEKKGKKWKIGEGVPSFEMYPWKNSPGLLNSLKNKFT
jgi:hypothetical protein